MIGFDTSRTFKLLRVGRESKLRTSWETLLHPKVSHNEWVDCGHGAAGKKTSPRTLPSSLQLQEVLSHMGGEFDSSSCTRERISLTPPHAVKQTDC